MIWIGTNTDGNTLWIADATREALLMAMADGSCSKTTNPDLSGAGWILFCIQTGKSIRGTIMKKSKAATSY